MKKYIAFVATCMIVAVAVFLSGFAMPTSIAIGVLVVAILSDTTTTYLCLRKKGQEGNPVVARLFRWLGYRGTTAVWLGIWVLIIWFRVLPAGEQVQTAVAIAYWMVPANNLMVLRRLTKAQRNTVAQVAS